MAGGFLHDMQKKLEYNRAILKKTNRFKTRKLYDREIKKANLKLEKATPEQIKMVRKKVKQQRQVQLRKNYLTLILASLSGLLIVVLLLYWISLW